MANPFEQSDYDQGTTSGGAGGYNPPAAASDYNPFAASAATATAAATSAPTGATKAAPFAASGGSDEVRMREAALAKRAAELDEKERQLKKREAELGAAGFRPPNWPVCKPILYHDIKEEVPASLQSMVKAAYYNWIAYTGAMVFNWFSVMIYFFLFSTNKPSGFVAACFLMLLGPPLAWMMSYKSLYTGITSGKGSPLLWYCLTQGCTIGMCMFLFLGIPDTGGGGIFLLISAGAKKHSNAFCTIVLGITTGLWGALLFYGAYVLKRVWHYYKISGSSGRTEEEIRSELAKQALKQ